MTFSNISFVLFLGIYNIAFSQPQSYSTPFFNETDQEYFSRTVIEYKDFKLKGTLAVKTFDAHHKRAAIVSDFGNTLMDLEFKNERIQIIYIIDDLNKYFILKRLKNIFALLLKTQYSIKSESEENNREKIFTSRFRRKKILIKEQIDSSTITLIQRSLFRKLVTFNYYTTKIQVISNRSPLKMTFDDIVQK